MNAQSLEILESRIKNLIGKINQLRRDNEDLDKQLSEACQRATQYEAEATLANSNKNAEELSGKIQFQQQQIQLLEKERVNLREQINFLQDTIQNKESNWQTRLAEHEQQQTEFQTRLDALQAQLQTAQEGNIALEQTLEQQKQQANEQLAECEQHKKSLQEQLENVQKQLADTQIRLNTSNTHAEQLQNQLLVTQQAMQDQEQTLTMQLKDEQEKAAAKLAQEAESFRIETALQAQKYEQNLHQLNIAFKQQKEHSETEKSVLVSKINQLRNQNQEYRQTLQQNADNIRALLARLPALFEEESDEVQTIQLENSTSPHNSNNAEEEIVL